MLAEVAGEATWVPYLEYHYRNNPEGLAKEKKFLEMRLVGEAIGEKLCIMTGPLTAFALNQAMRRHIDDDEEQAAPTPGELAEIAAIYLAMEEVVDMLTLVLMVTCSIYALRVRPQMSVRTCIFQGLVMSCCYGFLKMAALANAY